MSRSLYVFSAAKFWKTKEVWITTLHTAGTAYLYIASSVVYCAISYCGIHFHNLKKTTKQTKILVESEKCDKLKTAHSVMHWVDVIFLFCRGKDTFNICIYFMIARRRTRSHSWSKFQSTQKNIEYPLHSFKTVLLRHWLQILHASINIHANHKTMGIISRASHKEQGNIRLP